MQFYPDPLQLEPHPDWLARGQRSHWGVGKGLYTKLGYYLTLPLPQPDIHHCTCSPRFPGLWVARALLGKGRGEAKGHGTILGYKISSVLG